MSARAMPFHCPYCGDEDLRPSEQSSDGRGAAWECHSCLRVFALTMLGQLARPSLASTSPQSSEPHQEVGR